MIRGATATECWEIFTEQIWGYWGRLSEAGQNRGVIAVRPTLRFDSAKREGEVSLGDMMRDRVPMATSTQVNELFERALRDGVLIGQPPKVLVLGIQKLAMEQDSASGSFVLRTSWYKYCLVVRSAEIAGLDAPPSFAMRLESDGRMGWNSWLLNHPIHHVQLGLCNDLRILASRGRSLVSFVDAALRLFAEDAWAEMYPGLYLELKEPSGHFAPFTQCQEGADFELRARDASKARDIVRRARAEGLEWHKELDQWREDIDAWSECAPEMFDVLASEVAD